MRVRRADGRPSVRPLPQRLPLRLIRQSVAPQADGLQNYCRECTRRGPVSIGRGSSRRCPRSDRARSGADAATRPSRSQRSPPTEPRRTGCKASAEQCAAKAYRAEAGRCRQGRRARQRSCGAQVLSHVAARRSRGPSGPENKRASDGSADPLQGVRVGRRPTVITSENSYGMTVADLDAMLLAQHGVCAICQTAPAVHVDHDHQTDKVRGLLCFRCNAALGQLGDDPLVVRRAARYLERGGFRAAPDRPGGCRSRAAGRRAVRHGARASRATGRRRLRQRVLTAG